MHLVNEVRDSTRAVTDEGWIKDMLRRAAVCSLATAQDGQPFINVTLFAYDEARQAIFLHSAKVGRIRANVERNDRVCFSVHDIGRFLPHAEALHFDVEYSSVVVFGRVHLLVDQAEAEHGLQLLLDKYAPHLRPARDYRPITPEEIERTAVYRLDIEQWSGKRNEAPEDTPGAFVYKPTGG